MFTFNDSHASRSAIDGANGRGGPQSPLQRVRRPAVLPSVFTCCWCDSFAVLEDLWVSDAEVWLDCPFCGSVTTIDGPCTHDDSERTVASGPLVASQPA
jgi:hypothetical protein